MVNREENFSSCRNKSEKKTDLSAETEKYFAERAHLILRPASNLLNKPEHPMGWNFVYLCSVVPCKNRAIKWGHTKTGAEGTKRLGALSSRCLRKF